MEKHAEFDVPLTLNNILLQYSKILLQNKILFKPS